MTLIHGRHIGPLATVWTGGCVIAAAIYVLQKEVPALVDMLTPLYIILLMILLVATVKWFRERGRERRRADRRHTDRRDIPMRDTTQ